MNKEKFKNLVLYILSNSNYDDEGIKKLNKILYFIDFYYYRDHEELITGARYAKAGMGPIVDNYKQVFDKLCKDQVLEKQEGDGKIFHRPKLGVDVSVFSSTELDHINRVIERYGKLSSSELESISHEQQPWVLTENDGEIIDPDLALLMGDDGEEIEVGGKLRDELIEMANMNQSGGGFDWLEDEPDMYSRNDLKESYV